MSWPGSWGTRRTIAPATGFPFFKAKPEREQVATAAWTTRLIGWPEGISMVRPETVAPVASRKLTWRPLCAGNSTSYGPVGREEPTKENFPSEEMVAL